MVLLDYLSAYLYCFPNAVRSKDSFKRAQSGTVGSKELAASYRAFDQAMMSPQLKTPWEYLKHIFWDVLHPYSTVRATWDSWILVLLSLLALLLPVHISFGVVTSAEVPRAESLAFWLIDGIFFLDILLNFRTAVWAGDHAEGALKWERGEIAIDYLHSWFLVDILSATPWPALIRFSAFLSRDMASQSAECAPWHENLLIMLVHRKVSSGVCRSSACCNAGC